MSKEPWLGRAYAMLIDFKAAFDLTPNDKVMLTRPELVVLIHVLNLAEE